MNSAVDRLPFTIYSRMKNRFVYCICGDSQVETLNWSLRILRSFTKSQILVIAARVSMPIDHHTVRIVEVPTGLDDHQASIYLKTSLPTLCADGSFLNCYLDSDQIAISSSVDDVFEHYAPPISFALDHGHIERFSHSALNCGCIGRCSHLRDALAEKFRVHIGNPDWRHWNGGLFLFDHRSVDFCRLWHEYTLLIFEDPYWRVRDQASLIATVWTLGIENHPAVPGRFNFIVDRFKGIPESDRPGLSPEGCTYVESYRLGSRDAENPVSIHLINGGVGRTGWQNWDEVVRYLDSRANRARKSERADPIHAHVQ